MQALDTTVIAAELATKIDATQAPTHAPQPALVQELPLDLLDHIGGGSGLTLII